MALALPAAAAPAAGPNVNVMSGNKFPDGDPFLTKQNEPSIAVSSRNPRNLLAASNDYRTAELATIEGVGGGKGWLTLYKSTDGGATWRPFLLSGCSVPIAECTGGNSALRGLEFSADPTLRSGPYGTFFFSFIAGNRASSSGGVTAVQRFFDRNDAVRRGQDPFAADALSILDAGTSGQFKDKPWVAADVPGRPWLAGNTCDLRPHYGTGPVPAFNVYASFSNFVGNAGGEGTPQLFVATSDDCGKTFAKAVKVSESIKRNSGSSLVVDPATGHAYVIWRQFGDGTAADPHGIYISKSTDGGRKWSKPTLVSNITAFDQGTTATAFRSTGFPSLAVSVDANGASRMHVAWAERKAALDPATAACIAPDGNCDARIVIATSSDGGSTFPSRTYVDDWTFDPTNPANPGRGHQIQPALTFAAGKLAVAWVDQRHTQTVGELRCTKAACTYPADYSEVRVPVGALAACAPEAGGPSGAACLAGRGQAFRPFISDAGLTRRHTVDTFVATAPVSTDGVLRFTSARAAQYRYAQFDAVTGRNCTASSANCVVRQTRFNVPNLPMFVNGTLPFFGDYIDIAAQSIVPSGDTFKFNTGVNAATQVGGLKARFHAAWADDRDVVPPKRNPDGTQNWANYKPLFNLDALSGAVSANAQACMVENGKRVNTGQSGNRDQNVYTAVIGEGWTAYANAPSKNLTSNGAAAPRGFVISVENLELASDGRFQLTASPGAGVTQASFIYPGAGTPAASVTVDVARRSSATRTLWVTATDPKASVAVLVRNLNGPADDTTTLVLNPDRGENPLGSADGRTDLANNNLWYPNTGPGAEGLANVELANIELANNKLANIELANIELANIELANAELANVELANIELANAELANIELANIELANVPIIESTVIVKNSGNTDTTLAVKPLVRNLPAGIKTQLVVRKIALTPVVGNACVPTLVQRNAQVASIPSPRLYSPSDPDLTRFPDVASSSETGAATLPLSVDELAQVTLRIIGKGLTQDQALDLGKWGTKFVVVDAKPNTVTTVPLVIKTFVLPAVQANAVVTIPSAPNGLQAIGGAPGTGLAWTVESVTPQAGFPSLLPGAVTVDAASGALTITNAPPGKYDLVVSVRDCAATACGTSQQQDLQKLTLTVAEIRFLGEPLPPAIAVNSTRVLPAATSGSGDPVIYTAPIDPLLAPQPNRCSITSAGNPAIYTLVAGSETGVCTIIAWAGGATIQLSVTVTTTLAVKNAQAITFPAIAPKTYAPGGTFEIIGATATSGLSVAFASTTPATCTVSGTMVSIVAAGSCTITADQPGSALYLAAPQVAQTVTINKAAQAITFTTVASVTYAPGAMFPISATASSGLGVTFGSLSPAVCSVSGSNVAVLNAGNCTIAADQAGNGNYNPAPQASQTVTIGKAAQSITFPAVATQTYSPGATVGISATANSGATPNGLLVAFTASGSCTVSASTLAAGSASTATVTLTGGGTCTLTANQAGNGNYSAATAVVQGFSIAKAAQTITFGTLPDVTLPAAPIALSASSSSGLAVSFSSLTTSVCTVSGTTATLVAAGACTIAANQAGDSKYEPAPQVARSFAVKPSWIATGAMLQPRSWHTATLLNDGKVLVAGGLDASGASTATSEVYDPATGTFAPVSNLPSKSAGHTATLLSCACASNGKVLLAGGGNSSAGIYDPVTRNWSGIGGIGGNRSYHTATVLQNRKVLIVGGADNSDKPIASTLLFDPVTGGFSNGPTLSVARERHVAVMLADGRVLVAGGRAKAGSGYTVIASAEIYDPVAGKFTAAGNFVAGRHSANAVLLTDGRVLVAGGSGDSAATSAAALVSTEIFTPTPVAGAWALASQTPVLATARKDFGLTALSDGRSLATGGQNSTGRLGLAEFYTLAAGAPGTFAAAPTMLTARSGHTATRLLNGRVLVIGGVGTAGKSISATEYYQTGP